MLTAWQSFIRHRAPIVGSVLFGLMLGSGWPGPAAAQLLEDIEVDTEQGVVEYRLHFSVPVQYVKHFPQERGELIKLYLQALRLDDIEPVDHLEYKRTPKLTNVPAFKLVYSTVRNCFTVRDPICLDFQFNQPVRFRFRPETDGRTIVLIVLPDSENRNSPPAKKK